MRNGFVSNSSSASFIVTWQIDKDFLEEGVDIFDRTFCLLFGVGSDSDGNYSPDFSIWEQEKEVYEAIKANTTMIDSNTFKSEFRTSMLNSPVDFGSAAAYLLLALETFECPNSVKLIEKHIDRD